MTVHGLWLGALVASLALTRVAMRFAERQQLLDIPNERSSHDRPVPRTGGIAVVVTFMAAMVFAWAAGLSDAGYLLAILGGGGLVALVGAADDYRDLPAGWRLTLHLLAAAWALYWLHGVPAALLPDAPPLFINALGILCTVWLINLFNFMDGIDAIAGIETLTVCVAGIVILTMFGGLGEWISPAILAASVAGFLVWNFPPARVFLGDVGSGFLGLMMAIYCIRAGHQQPELFWAWLILLGVFIVDASVTLARRLLRRQRAHEAHRSHAYQFASRKYASHAPVSLAVGAINLLWLLPMAWLASSGRIHPVAALLIAYAPLLLLAIYFKAGAPEFEET
ncbi:MAG: glycosyltransferase family 4 protein [Woeseiaceae bacterium]|nr:glycosyltransferase family 4 protein [Woeseiaceae bacterium]